jgi:hypothetical protein
MLKYSINKIENIDDYNKKKGYLNNFRESGVIDQETYVELQDFLDKKLRTLAIKA